MADIEAQLTLQTIDLKVTHRTTIPKKLAEIDLREAGLPRRQIANAHFGVGFGCPNTLAPAILGAIPQKNRRNESLVQEKPCQNFEVKAFFSRVGDLTDVVVRESGHVP